MNWWIPRSVAAKEASLAVTPPASALAHFITHRVRCHFTLPGTVSTENLIKPPEPRRPCCFTVHRASSSSRAGMGGGAGLSVTGLGGPGVGSAVRAGSCAAQRFLLGFLRLATSPASLRVSLPTEPLIKRGFV